MNVYIFIGGAYGEDYWTQQFPPDKDQMDSWKCGELLVVKVDSEMRIWQPDGIGNWQLVRTRKEESRE